MGTIEFSSRVVNRSSIKTTNDRQHFAVYNMCSFAMSQVWGKRNVDGLNAGKLLHLYLGILMISRVRCLRLCLSKASLQLQWYLDFSCTRLAIVVVSHVSHDALMERAIH